LALLEDDEPSVPRCRDATGSFRPAVPEAVFSWRRTRSCHPFLRALLALQALGNKDDLSAPFFHRFQNF
jgi:hypothetical protein